MIWLKMHGEYTVKDLLLIRSNQNILDEFNYYEIAEIIDDVHKN